jgi:lipopolysaccharide export system permease protein
MFTVLDRYLLRSLLVNYAVALAVMISLYIVLDMFVNMDEFTEHGYALYTVVANMVDYYVPNIFLYFAQLSGVITLFACTAVLARMRKLNELTAILASGVSLYRVARPVVIFGIVMTGLLIVDTEWVIPAVAHKLSRDHDDADGKRAYEVLFLQDRGGALLSAERFHPATHDLKQLLVLMRDEEGKVWQTWEADRAIWEPADESRPHGRWKLERGRLTTRLGAAGEPGLGPREDQRVTYPAYYESDLKPEDIQLRQAQGWVRYLSLRQLRELQADRSADIASIVQTRHTRISAPIVGMLLLLLGVPFFLDRSPANVVSDAGKCLLVCGLCYVITFVAQNVRSETASALPAWIPIFVFGTLAVVLLDRVRT